MLPSLSRSAGILRKTLFCAFLLLLASCKGGYIYTFNDNVVYRPGAAGEPNANVFRDANLQGCLNQALEAEKITDLAKLKLLACAGSNVEVLAGIQKLSGLEQLELSDNKIKDLRPLGSLKNLRVLGLRNNPFSTVSPLNDMQLLRFVSLQGDEQLSCSEIAGLKARLGNTLSEPLHCVK